MGTAKKRRNWTEDEIILTLYYYCQIPFAKIDKANPTIIRVANLIGRTPSAVTLKMGNLGHFDPSLQQRNVVGMSNASKLDELMVLRFLNHWEDLVLCATRIEEKILWQKDCIDEKALPIGVEVEAEVKRRANQTFFRKAVLNAYSQKCCITGIPVPELLIASHIKPWAVSDPERERVNPSNGLCLNALHDKAFDKGLITVLPDYTIRVSPHLKKNGGIESLQWLFKYEHHRIMLPERFLPGREFLEYHNDVVFKWEDKL